MADSGPGSRAFIRAGRAARPGDVISVKVLIRHAMESGHRRDRVGKPIPRNIIHRLVAHYDGQEVFSVELFPGMAANPYLEFRLRATHGATLTCTWTDDQGVTESRSVDIQVG